jgi:protein subunit release factor A
VTSREPWCHPFAEDVLQVDVYSNTSGQAFRILHIPTGTVGESAWQKSYFAARAEAMGDLRRKTGAVSAE